MCAIGMDSDAPMLAFILDEPVAAQLMRSTLIQYGIERTTVAGDTAQIRRKLVLGDDQSLVVCIALTDRTISRHGRALRRLRADRNGFSAQMRFVGLLTDAGVTPEVAQLGCDVYVHSLPRAASVIHLLAGTCGARRAKLHRARQPGANASGRPCARAWRRGTRPRHAEIRVAKLHPHWVGSGRWNGTTRFGRRIVRLRTSDSGRDQGS